MKIFFTIYLFVFITASALMSHTPVEIENALNSNYAIYSADVKDFSKKLIRIKMRGRNITRRFKAEQVYKSHQQKKWVKLADSKDELVFKVFLENEELRFVRGSVKFYNKEEVRFEVKSERIIPDKDLATIHIILHHNLEKIGEVASYSLKIPKRSNKAGQQPYVLDVVPAAGIAGDTITIKGINFGDNIDSVFLFYLLNDEDPDYEFKEKLIVTRRAIFLSKPDAKTKEQIVRFSLPKTLISRLQEIQKKNFGYLGSLKSRIFGETITIKLMINSQPSEIKQYVVLNKNWKTGAVIISLTFIAIFLAMISLVMKRLNFFPYIFLDVKSNTYSLSRFQAFSWTLILLGSYCYVAICWGLILQGGKMPDFNASLLGLMAISYGGLISAAYLDDKKSKNELRKPDPSMKNFICSGSVIDLSRLQLFGFTIVAIIIYLFNLLQTNVLNGLPDIPTTLHGLLTTSQTGYIAAKVITNKISINYISPQKWFVKERETELEIIGNGFTDGMQLLIEPVGKPIPVQKSTSNSLSCKITIPNQPGKHDLVLLPTSGSNVILTAAIEIIDDEDSELVAISQPPIENKDSSENDENV